MQICTSNAHTSTETCLNHDHCFRLYYKAPLLTTLTYYTTYSSSRSAEAGRGHRQHTDMFVFLRPMPGGSWDEVWARSTPNIGL